MYDELGIRIPQEEKLRGVARDSLYGVAREATLGEGRHAVLRDFHTEEVAFLLTALGGALGVDAVREFEHWVRYVVCTDPPNPWILYQDLFGIWASRFRKSGKDHLNLSANPVAIEVRFRSACDLASQAAVLDQQRRKPLSDWDFRLFVAHGGLEIPQGSDFFPFADAVLLIIAMARFQSFWQWLVSSIGAPDLSSIESAARERAETRGKPFYPIEMLRLRA